MRLSDCTNIADLRRLAKRRLPAPIFGYLEGGADDEWSCANNSRAFDRYELVTEVLADIAIIDMKTTVLGREVAAPLLLSPTGMSRLFHHDKELAVARAAARAGLFYTLSTVATASIEEVAAASAGPKMFQVYVFKDRGLTRELVARAKTAGYDALCLTVDTPVAGNRERDLKSGLALPPRLSPASIAAFARHPIWVARALASRDFTLANVAHHAAAAPGEATSVAAYVHAQFDRSLTWADAEWLASEWNGPLVIKGILVPDDAREAARVGARAVMISNHGGRQLDGTPAPIDQLRPIRDAVGDDLELIVDGGIRRGTHVVKALALGADACSIGRPYLYGLAAGGEAGVARALTLLLEEIERDMALLGTRSIDRITRRHVQVRTRPHPQD
ncbi:MAG: alpha-hydroxy-acid oxidizing protein [Alphaproteobacteria bacterium]|nr:MAG: alpha-hydroxy-acid oxidizing protein [Alphaproteobacteria bacterium]